MKIAIVTTGGTIDKEYFDALSDYKIGDSIVDGELQKYRVGFEYQVVPLLRKDSLELDDDDRALIVKTVSDLPQQHILITHGTDTMVTTAKALANIKDKTIVLTGAMKPARFKDTDAIFNVGVAIGALQCLPAGAYVAMSGRIFDPHKVSKNREAGQFQASDG
ncbi:MAG: asparaginase domain-containing protein [Oleiphilaceae bacterium]|nr:asparaginase domain-containing protein [Oleiphilaceae bacterium]